jgi:hypothetical protein
MIMTKSAILLTALALSSITGVFGMPSAGTNSTTPSASANNTPSASIKAISGTTQAAGAKNTNAPNATLSTLDTQNSGWACALNNPNGPDWGTGSGATQQAAIADAACNKCTQVNCKQGGCAAVVFSKHSDGAGMGSSTGSDSQGMIKALVIATVDCKQQGMGCNDFGNVICSCKWLLFLRF